MNIKDLDSAARAVNHVSFESMRQMADAWHTVFNQVHAIFGDELLFDDPNMTALERVQSKINLMAIQYKKSQKSA